MDPITNDTAMDFIRQLVNLGGIDKLKEPDMLIEDSNGELQCINDGDKRKPIQIVVPGIVKNDDNFLFNPFKSVEGNNPAYNWFYTSRSVNMAVNTKLIMAKIIKLAANKEMKDYESLNLISDICSACDEQMYQEFMKINSYDILRVFYNKKIKTAEAQTLLLSDDIEVNYKFRRKTLTTIRTIFRKIFDLKKDENDMSSYKYRATILNIPEIDAKLHVIAKIMEKIAPWSNLIDVTFDAARFNMHLNNLEAYSRMYAWFTARSVNDKTIVSNQHKSEGLPLITSSKDDTTIKLGSVSVPYPVISPVTPMVSQPMTAYPRPMTAFPQPTMTAYLQPQQQSMSAYPMNSYWIPAASCNAAVEHDRIAVG